MDNERKNHNFPAPIRFPTLEQLENSIKAIKSHHSSSVSDPRIKRYDAMKSEAVDREIEHLRSEERSGVITKRGLKTLSKLTKLKEEQKI